MKLSVVAWTVCWATVSSAAPPKYGTYGAPHRQTNADHTQLDNDSTKGNVPPRVRGSSL